MNSQASRQRREQRIAFLEAEKRVNQLPHASDWAARMADFPDPWLFGEENLIRELDRIRELALAIPNNSDRHATHFQREIVVTAIWNLRETIRYLQLLRREGQWEFAKKTATMLAKPSHQNKKQRAAKAKVA